VQFDENNPVHLQIIDVIRIGRRLVATAIGFRAWMWAGGVECFGGRGVFLTHPDHRGQQICGTSNRCANGV
jgi:hypothetical protein